MKFNQTTWIGVLSIAVVLLSQGFAIAQQETAAEEVADKLVELRPVFDLGRFEIKDLRPTRNETIELSFHMLLAMNKSTSEHTVQQLEHWKHRLRNQVLIASRLSVRQDFLEPDLHRFRRVVKIRVNRLLKAILVDEIFLTEFAFKTSAN